MLFKIYINTLHSDFRIVKHVTWTTNMKFQQKLASLTDRSPANKDHTQQKQSEPFKRHRKEPKKKIQYLSIQQTCRKIA